MYSSRRRAGTSYELSTRDPIYEKYPRIGSTLIIHRRLMRRYSRLIQSSVFKVLFSIGYTYRSERGLMRRHNYEPMPSELLFTDYRSIRSIRSSQPLGSTAHKIKGRVVPRIGNRFIVVSTSLSPLGHMRRHQSQSRPRL